MRPLFSLLNCEFKTWSEAGRLLPMMKRSMEFFNLYCLQLSEQHKENQSKCEKLIWSG